MGRNLFVPKRWKDSPTSSPPVAFAGTLFCRVTDLPNRRCTSLASSERADRLWNDSRKIRGLPQEKDEVQKAVDDYDRALQLYQEIAPYGNASTGIARIQAIIGAVKGRLLELQAGADLWR